MSLAIVDLAYGNLGSVAIAFERLGLEPLVTADPDLRSLIAMCSRDGHWPSQPAGEHEERLLKTIEGQGSRKHGAEQHR